MKVPRLFLGTAIGALIGGIVINPCSGGAAFGAILGTRCGLLADLGPILRSAWAKKARLHWIAFKMLSRGPVVGDGIVLRLIGLMVLGLALVWFLKLRRRVGGPGRWLVEAL